MKKYYCSWDKTTRWITLILTPLLFVAVLACFIEGTTLGLVAGCFLLLMILLSIFLCPIYATKDKDVVTLSFLFYKRKFDLSNNEIEFSGNLQAKNLIRLCASGGFFGYWGIWKTSEGKFTFYLVNLNKDVCVLTPKNGKRKIAINLPKSWLD